MYSRSSQISSDNMSQQTKTKKFQCRKPGIGIVHFRDTDHTTMCADVSQHGMEPPNNVSLGKEALSNQPQNHDDCQDQGDISLSTGNSGNEAQKIDSRTVQTTTKRSFIKNRKPSLRQSKLTLVTPHKAKADDLLLRNAVLLPE